VSLTTKGLLLVITGLIVGCFLLALDRFDAERSADRLRVELEQVHRQHAVALAQAQSRYTERETVAQEALDEYRKEVVVPRPVPSGERLRGAIAAAGDRDREAAAAECAGAADRAALYRDLLDEADQLLGEGENLAAELAGAAEQHASEVRLLKRRAVSDRSL